MSKKIVICFDGTNNHPCDAKQEREWFGRGEIKDNGITNVLKIHALLGGNLANQPSRIKACKGQRSFYYSGVGTYGSKIQQMFNAGFASSNLDIRTIMHHASRDLNSVYDEGEEIIITGFSRGAAIARKFASRLADFLPAAKDASGPIIKLLAVFDTVAAIGMPNLQDHDKPTSDVVFEDHTVSPLIEQAVHLVSLDDRRKAFWPTMMNKEDRITEVWFPGAHSDVGGGFWHDGLSDIALEFMRRQMIDKAGLHILDPAKVDFEGLCHKDEYQIDHEDLDIKPNKKGVLHSQDRWGPVDLLTLGHRQPRVNIKDQPCDQPVLVHKSVFERIDAVTEYRPKSMKGIAHQIVDDNGSTINRKGKPSKKIFHGLKDHI